MSNKLKEITDQIECCEIDSNEGCERIKGLMLSKGELEEAMRSSLTPISAIYNAQQKKLGGE